MDLGIAAAKAHGVAIAAAAATREALAWITTEGAKMPGAEWRIGSLAAGKQADIVLVRAGDLNMQPLHDAVSAIVFQASLANTDSVRVAGCWKKRGGAPARHRPAALAGGVEPVGPQDHVGARAGALKAAATTATATQGGDARP